jgi:LysR family transcriptional regulator, transcriptional activator for bauABCD operon
VIPHKGIRIPEADAGAAETLNRTINPARHIGSGNTVRDLNDIDLKQLRVFAAVADCGGFTAAEDRLNINCSSISKYISDLEARLKVRLCSRGRGGFGLTPAGEKLYQIITQLLSSVASHTRDIDTLGRKAGQRLRIGIIDSAVLDDACPVSDGLYRMQSDVPGLRVDLCVMPARDIVLEVLKGDLDVGITLMPRKVSGLKLKYLYEEHVRPYVSVRLHEIYANKRVDIAAVRELPIAAYEYREFNSRAKDGWDVKLCSQLDVVAMLTLAGHHVGMLPAFYAQHWVSQDKIRELEIAELGYKSPIYAIRKPAGANQSVVSSFLAHFPTTRPRRHVPI